jgi:hypothetical protein
MKILELFEKDLFGKTTPSPEEVAKKHDVPLSQIMQQLKLGVKIEHEHTQDAALAREIALDHLSELPDYYTGLAKMEKE